MFIKNIKSGILLVMVILLLTACSQKDRGVSADLTQNPETSKQLEQFNQMGDKVYNKTIEGEFLEARAEIVRMNDLVPQIRLIEVTTNSGVKAISDTLLQAMTTFNAVQLDTELALFQSARIRLMADALSHPLTPLWLQFNKVIQEDIVVMEQASKQKKYQELKLSFNLLKVHYLTIQPALQVSLQTDEINKLANVIHDVETELQAATPIAANLNHAIKTLHAGMEDLFQMKSEATAYLPFMESKEPNLNWMLILASIIIIILGFVAWRMRAKREGIITIRR